MSAFEPTDVEPTSPDDRVGPICDIGYPSAAPVFATTIPLVEGEDMRRREFLGVLGGAAAAWPLVARAQQATVPVIGYFSARSFDAEAPLRVPFLEALEQAGFAPGRNVMIEYRFGQGQDERLPELAAELVHRQVAVLVATGGPSAVAAKGATATIPIVFTSGSDPVQLGLVTSFNRPGGNATGVAALTGEPGPKGPGLLREVLPRPGTIAFIVNANSMVTPAQVDEMKAAAQAIGQPLLVIGVDNEEQVEQAFATMAERNVVAVLYGATLLFQVISERLVAL